ERGRQLEEFVAPLVGDAQVDDHRVERLAPEQRLRAFRGFGRPGLVARATQRDGQCPANSGFVVHHEHAGHERSLAHACPGRGGRGGAWSRSSTGAESPTTRRRAAGGRYNDRTQCVTTSAGGITCMSRDVRTAVVRRRCRARIRGATRNRYAAPCTVMSPERSI